MSSKRNLSFLDFISLNMVRMEVSIQEDGYVEKNLGHIKSINYYKNEKFVFIYSPFAVLSLVNILTGDITDSRLSNAWLVVK